MALEKLRAKFPNGVLRNQHPFYMADAIADIPGCLEACISEPLQNQIRTCLGDFQPENVFTIGCGTSYNACQVVSYFVRNYLHIPAYTFNAHDFLEDTPPGLGTNSMVISISESGQSITTCLAQEKSRDLGAFTVGISANPKSRLTTTARLGLTDPYLHEIPLGKTRTFLTTAMLGVLAGACTDRNDKLDELIASMKEVISLLRSNLDRLDQAGKLTAEKIAVNAKRYFTAGFGCQKAVSDEITLKMIEVVGESSTSFGLEEFTHGPSATFREDLAVVLLQTDDRTLEKSVRIAHGVAISKAQIVVITDHHEAGWPTNAHLISLPQVKSPRIFGLFSAAVAAQYLFYYLAIQKGLNPDVNSEDIHPELGDIYAFFFPPGTH